MKKRILCIMLILAFFVSVLPVHAGAATVTRNTIARTSDGWDYEFWSQDTGNGSMTVGNNATFSCTWDGANNILFRMGKKYNETQTHSQLGEVFIDYEADFRITKGDVAYLCVYGWTTDPLIEFYILESFGSYNPGRGGTNSEHKGTINVDGSIYDIYTSDRINQPSIKGTRTFKQYWSVRRTKRASGTISVSEHFKAWEAAGMTMGKMYEIATTVEAYGGASGNAAGNADITKNNYRFETADSNKNNNDNANLPSGNNSNNIKPPSDNNSDNAKPPSGDNSGTQAQVLPGRPLAPKAAAVSASSVSISWRRVNDADGYEVWRTDSKNGTFKRVRTIAKNTVTNLRDGRLKADTQYFYKVRAYKTVDGRRVYSEYSLIRAARTLK